MASNRDRSFYHRVAQSASDRSYNAAVFLAHHSARKGTKEATVAKVSVWTKLKALVARVWAKVLEVVND